MNEIVASYKLHHTINCNERDGTEKCNQEIPQSYGIIHRFDKNKIGVTALQQLKHKTLNA